MALGILVEAMARWLGFAEWVSAETRNFRPRKPAEDGRLVPVDVPDHVVATAGYPGGVVATIEMSTVTMRGRGIRAWFLGSDGVLEADFGAQTLTLRSGRRRGRDAGPAGRDPATTSATSGGPSAISWRRSGASSP